MATTIQVSEATKQTLVWLKKKENFSNYDQVIQKLLSKETKIPKTMFGIEKNLTWRKEDRLKLNES